MVKGSLFKSISYLIMTICSIVLCVNVVSILGGSFDMSPVELYNSLGVTGITILGAIIVMLLCLFVFFVRSLKQAIIRDKKITGKFGYAFRFVALGCLIAGLVMLFIKKVNPIELVLNGAITDILVIAILAVFALIMFIFEFVSIFAVKGNKRLKKEKQPKVRRRRGEIEVLPRQAVTDKQIDPQFRFGKKGR